MKVGRVVDLSVDVNLADLKPFERIVAAATYAYRNTDIYRRRQAETEEQREAADRKIIDGFINSLLATLVPFENGTLLADKEDTARAVLIEIPSRYTRFVEEVSSAHEFDAYIVRPIGCSELLRKHAEVPVLLYIEKR